MRYALVLLLAIGAANVGLVWASTENPQRFAVTATAERLGGRPGLAWDQLHPAHQRLISRAGFARCEHTVHGTAWHLLGVRQIRARPATIHYRGVSQRRATRVWLRIRASNGGAPFVSRWPVDVVRLGDRLRWLLDESTANQLRQDPSHCWE